MPQFPTFVDALPLTRRALEFAAERHEGQRREADDAEFILHPIEVLAASITERSLTTS